MLKSSVLHLVEDFCDSLVHDYVSTQCVWKREESWGAPWGSASWSISFYTEAPDDSKAVVGIPTLCTRDTRQT